MILTFQVHFYVVLISFYLDGYNEHEELFEPVEQLEFNEMIEVISK